MAAGGPDHPPAGHPAAPGGEGPLLADAEALWQRAFDAPFAIGAAACPPNRADEPPSPVQRLYDVIVPDVLSSI